MRHAARPRVAGTAFQGLPLRTHAKSICAHIQTVSRTPSASERRRIEASSLLDRLTNPDKHDPLQTPNPHRSLIDSETPHSFSLLSLIVNIPLLSLGDVGLQDHSIMLPNEEMGSGPGYAHILSLNSRTPRPYSSYELTVCPSSILHLLKLLINHNVSPINHHTSVLT